MKNVVVTGGSGKAGRAVCRHLVDEGYNVLNIDIVPSPDPVCPFYRVDLTDRGQVTDALQWTGGKDHPFRSVSTPDAIVHLAAIPAPDLQPEEVTFRNNIVSTYVVFDAALRAGIKRIVWASSETTRRWRTSQRTWASKAAGGMCHAGSTNRPRGLSATLWYIRMVAPAPRTAEYA